MTRELDDVGVDRLPEALRTRASLKDSALDAALEQLVARLVEAE